MKLEFNTCYKITKESDNKMIHVDDIIWIDIINVWGKKRYNPVKFERGNVYVIYSREGFGTKKELYEFLKGIKFEFISDKTIYLAL